eukprot:scaffold59883_cov66-Cyclotella_meneghiniana.AAC.3
MFTTNNNSIFCNGYTTRITRRGDGLSFKQIIQTLDDVVDQKELIIFTSIGWGLVPITKFIYGLYAKVTGRGQEKRVDETNNAEAGEKKRKIREAFDNNFYKSNTEIKNKSKIREAYENWTPWDDEGLEETIRHIGEKIGPLPNFEDTVVFHVVDHVSQASQIAIAVAIVDSTAHVAKLMGYTFQGWIDNASRLFSKIVYSGWITHRLALLKRFILRKTLLPYEGGDLGKLEVIDDLLTGVFYLIYFFHLLQYFEVQTGLAVKSLFSIGATGTLAFGLASKDLASQVLGGLTLHLSDKMYEGDSVRFSDGTSGVVEELGWMETHIRNSDEVTVRIPNKILGGQRIYNLSRTPRSQVKQTLRISYNSASKIPTLLQNIKEEIQKSCPKLITDGSRSFRAHWENFEADHLQVVVDTHFMITPSGNEYYENKQKVLEAIYRAVKNTGVEFEIRTDNCSN